MRRFLTSLALVVSVSWLSSAEALTSPIAGAVALPPGTDLRLPFPDGARVRVLSGYSPTGGSSLHADTEACCKANDYYALDLNYADAADGGLGMPLVAPLDGTVVRAGWATSGWANYGLRVILRHDLGDGHVYHTLYAHMNAIDPAVTEGSTVSRGQELGELGRSCGGALSCGSFSTPHLHFAMHRDSSVGGSGTGGSYGGNAVVPEAFDGAEDLARGDILISSNGGTVECGDARCSGGETHATCPADCPTCEPVPAEGRTLDEPELCVTIGGSAEYWRIESAGHGGQLRWTHTTDDAAPDNHAIWSLTFDEAGDYRLEAYTARAFAQSTRAGYTVRHGGSEETVRVDQSRTDGWNEIGTFRFEAGGDQWVRLDDNTGEPFADRVQIAFDAIRLTRAGAPGVDAGTDGGTDAGTVIEHDGSAPMRDGGPSSRPGGGTVDSGCGCSTTDRSGPPLFLIGAILALVLRRRAG